MTSNLLESRGTFILLIWDRRPCSSETWQALHTPEGTGLFQAAAYCGGRRFYMLFWWISKLSIFTVTNSFWMSTWQCDGLRHIRNKRYTLPWKSSHTSWETKTIRYKTIQKCSKHVLVAFFFFLSCKDRNEPWSASVRVDFMSSPWVVFLQLRLLRDWLHLLSIL